MRFDHRGYLQKNFGTADAVNAALADVGAEALPIRTVRQWFRRGSIPADYFPLLLLAHEQVLGAPPSVAPYMKGKRK